MDVYCEEHTPCTESLPPGKLSVASDPCPPNDFTDNAKGEKETLGWLFSTRAAFTPQWAFGNVWRQF